MANPETLAKVAEISGACAAFSCGLNSWVNDHSGILSLVGMTVGVLVGIGGLCTNVYYTRQRNKREQEAHNMQFFSVRP